MLGRICFCIVIRIPDTHLNMKVLRKCIFVQVRGYDINKEILHSRRKEDLIKTGRSLLVLVLHCLSQMKILNDTQLLFFFFAYCFYGSKTGFLGLLFPYDVRLVRKICGPKKCVGQNSVLEIFTTCGLHQRLLMWWKNAIKLGWHVACVLARYEKYTDTFKRKAQRKVPTWET